MEHLTGDRIQWEWETSFAAAEIKQKARPGLLLWFPSATATATAVMEQPDCRPTTSMEISGQIFPRRTTRRQELPQTRSLTFPSAVTKIRI
jgi:hypothetical protein